MDRDIEIDRHHGNSLVWVLLLLAKSFLSLIHHHATMKRHRNLQSTAYTLGASKSTTTASTLNSPPTVSRATCQLHNLYEYTLSGCDFLILLNQIVRRRRALHRNSAFDIHNSSRWSDHEPKRQIGVLGSKREGNSYMPSGDFLFQSVAIKIQWSCQGIFRVPGFKD